MTRRMSTGRHADGEFRSGNAVIRPGPPKGFFLLYIDSILHASWSENVLRFRDGHLIMQVHCGSTR